MTDRFVSHPEIQIKYAVGGIAVFDGDKTIYVNKDLKKYPKLLNTVLEHELNHVYDVQNEKTPFQALYNMVKTEIKDSKDQQKNKALFFFTLRHPRAFLPYMRCERKKIIVANQLFIFLWALTLIGLIFFVIASQLIF